MRVRRGSWCIGCRTCAARPDSTIADRIVTYYDGDGEAARVMEQFEAYVRQETLSDRLVAGAAPEGAYTEQQDVDGMQVARWAVMRVG